MTYATDLHAFVGDFRKIHTRMPVAKARTNRGLNLYQPHSDGPMVTAGTEEG